MDDSGMLCSIDMDYNDTLNKLVYSRENFENFDDKCDDCGNFDDYDNFGYYVDLHLNIHRENYDMLCNIDMD